jgi:hypothetical protein
MVFMLTITLKSAAVPPTRQLEDILYLARQLSRQGHKSRISLFALTASLIALLRALLQIIFLLGFHRLLSPSKPSQTSEVYFMTFCRKTYMMS